MKRRRILIAVVLLALAAYFGYNYLYQDHRDIQKETPAAELTASQISGSFTQNASDEYLNSTLLISGTITEMDATSITLDGKVHCSFNSLPDALEIGQAVAVKGRCIGYDDLFELVKLDQCSIAK